MNKLEQFQQEHNLKPDGIIGPKTLAAFKKVFCIPSNEALAHFVGQILHETQAFRYESENLNYSAVGLKATFGKYFKESEFREFANKPQKIANRVYANRFGNGDEASGDGWKYRGRGAIQLTLKNNYRKFAEAMNDPSILSCPDVVCRKYFFHCAKFYFDSNHLWQHCDVVDNESIIILTRRINGGINGYQDRILNTKNIYSILTR